MLTTVFCKVFLQAPIVNIIVVFFRPFHSIIITKTTDGACLESASNKVKAAT